MTQTPNVFGCSRQVQVQRLVNELRLCKTPYTPFRFVTVSPQGVRQPGILLVSIKLTPSLCWTRVLRVVSLGGPLKGPGEVGGMITMEYLAML